MSRRRMAVLWTFIMALVILCVILIEGIIKLQAERAELERDQEIAEFCSQPTDHPICFTAG